MPTDIEINDQLKNDSSKYAKNIMNQYKGSIEEYKKMINKGTICWSKKTLHRNIYDIFELILNSKTKYTPVSDTLKKAFGITISRSSDYTLTFQPMEIKRNLDPGDPSPVIWQYHVDDKKKKEFLLIFRWIYEKTCNILFLHNVLPNETIDNLIRDLCKKIANDFMSSWVPISNLNSYKRNILKILEIPHNDPNANSLASIDDVENVDQIITRATKSVATTPVGTTSAATTSAATTSATTPVATTTSKTATTSAATTVATTTPAATTPAATTSAATTPGTVVGTLVNPSTTSNVIRTFNPSRRGSKPDHSNKVTAISDFDDTQGPQHPDPNIRINYLTIKKGNIISVIRRENEWTYGSRRTWGNDQYGYYINGIYEGYFPTDFVGPFKPKLPKTSGGKKNKKSKKVKLKNRKSKKRKTYKKRNN